MTRVLLTTTSFQDTPGIHHDMLAKAGFEIVRERGPLPEAKQPRWQPESLKKVTI